jgi:hypothetical protein
VAIITSDSYAHLPNKLAGAANGIDYAYRDTGPNASGTDTSGTVPLVLCQHFRGNLDSWDPALIDAVCTWGIPNHALLQRLGCLQMPVFVANGDSDRCKSGCAHARWTGQAA